MRMACCSAEWSNVAAVCLECKKFLCRDCVTAHGSSQRFQNHRVLTTDKAKRAPADAEQSAAEESACERHSKPLEHVCRTCTQRICAECVPEHPAPAHSVVAATQAEGLARLARQHTSDLHGLLGSMQLQSTQLCEMYEKAREDVAQTFKFCRSTLEKRREKIRGDLRSAYSTKMNSIEALDRKVRDCIDHVDRISAVVEQPTYGSSGAEALGLEERLESTAAALKRFLPEVERRSRHLDFKFSERVIQEGVRRFFGQVQTTPHEAAGPSGNALHSTVLASLSERGRALHQDGAEPPRPTSPCDLSLVPLGLEFSVAEVRAHPSQSGGGGDAPSTSALALSSPRLAPLTFRMKRKKMVCYYKFGSLGVLEGEFSEPSGVAVTSDNDIVVADANNHRIQIFDQEGRFKFQFGEVGRADGQLFFPSRVAVARDTGDIIVTERSPTHQVQVFNKSGAFVRKFGSLELQHPRGVAVDPLGRMVIIECRVMRVAIFDQSGNVVSKFVCSDHLAFPNGVAVNDKEEIFISDNLAHCVKVFSYSGAYLRQIGGEGVTNFPVAVCLSGTGDVLVADNHRGFKITVFTQDGALVKAYESNTKHAHCFDVAWMDGGTVVLASKDCAIHMYRYAEAPRPPVPPTLPIAPSSLLSHIAW